MDVGHMEIREQVEMPDVPRTRRTIHALVALNGFGLFSALVGAILAIARNGAGVPLAYLDGTPFSSYVVPGLILGFVVGGTQLIAATALTRRWPAALFLAAVAGFGMLLWIFVELAIIQQYSWLQAAYFGLGMIELILVFVLLGIMPRVVAGWHVR